MDGVRYPALVASVCHRTTLRRNGTNTMSLFWWGFVIGWAVGSSFLFVTILTAAIIRLYKMPLATDVSPGCDVCGVISGFHDQVKHQEAQARWLTEGRRR